MNYFKSWIVTLSSTLIFISIIEILLPKGSLKKYVKFVLGLILIAVIIDPITKIFNLEDNIKQVIDNYSSNSVAVIDESNFQNTDDKFWNNLKNNCVSMLKEKYPKDDFKVDIKGTIDKSELAVNIQEVVVSVNSGDIKKIEKIDLKNEKKTKELTDKEKKVRKLLADELKIDENKIKID